MPEDSLRSHEIKPTTGKETPAPYRIYVRRLCSIEVNAPSLHRAVERNPGPGAAKKLLNAGVEVNPGDGGAKMPLAYVVERKKIMMELYY